MKLGPRQQAILMSVFKNGGFWPGCGVCWNNFSTTKLILDSLVSKKLLSNEGNNRYSLTAEGKHLGDPEREWRERVQQHIEMLRNEKCQ